MIDRRLAKRGIFASDSKKMGDKYNEAFGDEMMNERRKARNRYRKKKKSLGFGYGFGRVRLPKFF